MYYKVIDSGYITSVGIATNTNHTVITETEYNNIVNVLSTMPAAPENYKYRLTENLTWELVKLPIYPPMPEHEPSTEDKAEAYEILMGVSE